MASIRRAGRVLSAGALLTAGLIPWAGPVPAARGAEGLSYTWEQASFPSGDGTALHADILRSPGTPAGRKSPVILTVSPYVNHAGVAGADYDPRRNGPSPRYFDFLVQARVLERGYTYVMVDLRGTGGSGGCTDWGGPGEQADVKAAVEWAGTQPWSSGRVGMFGMSYDGWTGLMAIANRPKHLAAVVAMEPVYDGYRYLYTNGVRFQQSVITPPLFVLNDAAPGTPADRPDYLLGGASPNAPCYALNIGGQQDDRPDAGFWQARALVGKATGARTPLFMTQGFLEQNTRPDGAFTFFKGMLGKKRAWFGQFDHVSGYEIQYGEIASGRNGFIAEAMRFFDRYVKGLPSAKAPTEKDPPVAVQAIDGRYRAEASWPPADAFRLSTVLQRGRYPDDNRNFGDAAEQRAGDKLWSISQPLRTAAHLSGEPVLQATVEAILPRANLVANVYDIDALGRAQMISRGTALVRTEGRSDHTIAMYGQDWTIPAGHRIGVTLSGSNREWWMHVPTSTEVWVERARISLPFLRFARTSFLDGWAGQRLLEFRLERFQVPAATIDAAMTRFNLPGPLQRRPAARGGR
ncbi:MAG: CocE/NonD family hydrolase [Actinomycetota bacterium]